MTDGLRAYLFDRQVRTDPASLIELNTRVAACYAWAERHGVEVVDETIAWADGGRDPREVLAELIIACRADRAALLVHSVTVIAPLLDPAGPVPGGPDGPELFVVDTPDAPGRNGGRSRPG